MNQGEKFFSVIIPTRNRAGLLRYALDSAINQDFDDYEVVVSDNNSTDHTKEVIEAAMVSSNRIRYLNPGSDLSMCDNWENVLAHAEGRYIILLCDDDVLPRVSLSIIHKVIQAVQAEILVWRYGAYGFADYPDPKARLKFTYPYTSGKVFAVSSEPMLVALLRFDWSVYGLVPKMLNCVVSRRALDVCRQRTGKFFLPPYPDFSAVGQLLAANSSYHFIDLPLYVSGASGASNAAFVMKRKKVFDDYLSLYGRDLLEGVPYAMRYLCTSYFHAGWRQIQQIYPEVIRDPIDIKSYLQVLFKELTMFEEHEDLAEELAQVSSYMREFSGSDEMFEHLQRKHLADKAKSAALITQRGTMGNLKELAWELVRRNPELYQVLSAARGHRVTEFSVGSVPTILAAARILEKYLRKHTLRVSDLNPIPVNSTDFLEASPGV